MVTGLHHVAVWEVSWWKGAREGSTGGTGEEGMTKPSPVMYRHGATASISFRKPQSKRSLRLTAPSMAAVLGATGRQNHYWLFTTCYLHNPSGCFAFSGLWPPFFLCSLKPSTDSNFSNLLRSLWDRRWDPMNWVRLQLIKVTIVFSTPLKDTLQIPKNVWRCYPSKALVATTSKVFPFGLLGSWLILFPLSRC